MKKTLKIGALILALATLLVLLTGCGGDKLVATKTTEDDGMGLGKYEETVEIKFKDDKVTEITMTSEFEKEESAQGMAAIFNMGVSMAGEKMEGFEVEQKGKKVIIRMDAKLFAEQEGISEEGMTKEAMKKALEEDGYTVK